MRRAEEHRWRLVLDRSEGGGKGGDGEAMGSDGEAKGATGLTLDQPTSSSFLGATASSPGRRGAEWPGEGCGGGRAGCGGGGGRGGVWRRGRGVAACDAAVVSAGAACDGTGGVWRRGRGLAAGAGMRGASGRRRCVRECVCFPFFDFQFFITLVLVYSAKICFFFLFSVSLLLY